MTGDSIGAGRDDETMRFAGRRCSPFAVRRSSLVPDRDFRLTAGQANPACDGAMLARRPP
ncbi:hypothetical protein A8H35_30085 [Burkholderia thailandensis]|nr:hypothetical protein WJ27_23455 [Burkholderia thailandensis]AVR08249.1 hypothetical protein A8H31_13015 [Burkholderia thailandensis]AWY62208.1 hypothetical protein A8H35_30085 [Burkholderia thailandensis]AWY64248.1 hypothetical protein A8H36_02290 [Burkholderia thailandensis]KVG11734.1 hypothetical protein WJ25_08530 [Burkholderia thailandensis]